MSRYEEYKDSCTTWMGQVPSHWKLERAKWHFTSRNERGNDTPVLLAATQKYGMYPQDMVEGVVKVAEGTDVQQFRTVHKGDFVISLRSFQGGFERSDYEGVCSPAYQVFYADDSWNNDYLKYLFKNELFIDAMNALTVGIREGRNIKYEDFANSVLAIPPLAEQADIAEHLARETDRIDAIIAEAKASIEEYKAWKTSIIYEAVTKGLDPNTEMKDSGVEWIGHIPNSWEVIPFTKGIASIVDYRGKTPEKVSEGVFLVTARNIKDGVINYALAQEYVKASEYEEIMRRGRPEIGDVLFTTEAPLGEVANVDRTDFALAQRVIKFRAKPEMLDNYYLKYWIMSAGFQQNLYTFATGSTAKGIKASKLGQLKVVCPPLDEQRKIVRYLDSKWAEINALIAEKEMLISDMEAYKKSLIFEVVTGKRKVV